MTQPTKVVVGVAAIRTLTGSELFGALAHAGLRRGHVEAALEALRSPEGDPDLALAGIRFLQAVALELALRNASANGQVPTWEEAQRWDVTADMTEPGESIVEAERREYRVAASLATGLHPDAAEALPVADVDAFARARERAGGA